MLRTKIEANIRLLQLRDTFIKRTIAGLSLYLTPSKIILLITRMYELPSEKYKNSNTISSGDKTTPFSIRANGVTLLRDRRTRNRCWHSLYISDRNERDTKRGK